jgi:hypothetical protein
MSKAVNQAGFHDHTLSSLRLRQEPHLVMKTIMGLFELNLDLS